MPRWVISCSRRLAWRALAANTCKFLSLRDDGTMERAVLVLSALLLNAFLAGPPRWYEALGLGKLSRLCAHIVRDAERRLNRDHRSASEREMRGILLVALVIIAALLGG